MLSAEQITGHLRHKIPVFSYDVIDSTNEAARRFLDTRSVLKIEFRCLIK